MKKILVALLIGLSLLTACSENGNKEMEEIQQKIEDASFKVRTGISKDTGYVFVQFPGYLNESFFITLKEGNEEAEALMHSYESSDGILTYRSYYFPEDDVKIANLNAYDQEICSGYNFVTKKYVTCSGGNQALSFITTIDDIMEEKLDNSGLDYEQLMKWAPWVYQNNN